MKDRRYSHVILIGIDGVGSCFREADSPNFDRIFENGAVTYGALAVYPTISAEGWGAMILGVGPEVHGLNNDSLGKRKRPADAGFPSLFLRIREKYPDAEMGSFCAWEAMNVGLAEAEARVYEKTGIDEELVPAMCAYIKEKRPAFLFSQLDSVDGAGHNFGYGGEEYFKSIRKIDSYLGEIYSSVEEAGISGDTLFMVIGDHGGRGWEHGGWTDAEKYVTFAACGKDVQRSEIKEMNIRDVSAIVLYALGIRAPEFDEAGWTSQIPDGIWKEVNGQYRDISRLTGAEPRISRVQHTSETS